MVARHGFEPRSGDPGPPMIDRYTTGLRLSEYHLLPISLTDKPGYEVNLMFHTVHLVIGENQVKWEAAYEIKILYND